MENSRQNEDVKAKVVSGLAWRFSERLAAQGVQFVVSVILARLLMPEDYGILALITVFISIASIFVESGLGSALIQKLDADAVDFSTAFYFNVAVAAVVYLLLFVLAPAISIFYGEPQLTPVLRVLGITLIIGGINGVQQAYVSRHMQFRRFFFSTIIGTVISAFVGIVMAYRGMGVWALAAQNLTNRCIDTAVLWFTVKWRPIPAFSLCKMKGMYRFGWKLLASSLINTVYNNLFSLIVGKAYTSSDLAYYNRGNHIPSLMITNINSSIQSVLFPVFSKSQGEKTRLKAMVRRSIVTSSFLILPMMAGLAAVAVPLTQLLLTEKWLPSVPFMRYCCFIYSLWPIHTANLQAITALGRSDVFLKLEIGKGIIGIAVLLVTLPLGLPAMMIGQCFTTVAASVLNAAPNKRLLDYGYLEQLKDILPTLGLSAFMGVAVWALSFFEWNNWLLLAAQVGAGVIIYISGAILFKMDSFYYILNTVKGFQNRKRNREGL